ncbi:vWA domain-containing protein [[Clostridium] polysaccharolyticum]|uniref:Ca-activated chloride channel family protein n=1 Tax=[Clostridium] polysaccharolyticum TaxID=29364 RepID=A0A1I0FVK1_9FIRM|nr:VWA domain-containing protein [[Clostridium] polysaccharolyticum]SET62550.1 Ca-activated chloride channel family protein [[Clostridium] polysaccharolyticum]
MKKNTAVKLVLIALVCFVAIYGGVSLIGGGDSSETMSQEDAIKKLEKLNKKVNPRERKAPKAQLNIAKPKLEDELPNIEKYPLSVVGKGDINIEIFVSPEKAGSGNEAWLNEVAEAFNHENIKINGKTASVSIRPIASGMGSDYIVSKKYVPDGYTPSNELWGQMMESQGVIVNIEAKRLAGNVAGILLSKKKQKELEEKYGAIDMKVITQATIDNEISMGYTNPYSSSTGLNFLLSTLNAYDKKDPLSDTAIEGFEKFQANVPFVAYTTMQMKEAAESGSLTGFILEYQTYQNSKDLKSYVFTPFGVRHDNPLYSIGNLSPDKKKVMKAFSDYCLQDKFQKKATNYGFNGMDDYKSEKESFTGNSLLEAQQLWKESKDSGRPVTAVFVADISGSMSGTPINELKSSLINASQYINQDNYVGLVSYSSDVNIDLPIGQFDLNQRALFTGAVEALDAGGETATFDAITAGLKMLMDAKEKNPDTKLLLFVLSDGETNRGLKLREIKGMINGLEIPVYTIGYNADISALESISQINEAASINADSDDVVYQLKNLFNAQM